MIFLVETVSSLAVSGGLQTKATSCAFSASVKTWTVTSCSLQAIVPERSGVRSRVSDVDFVRPQSFGTVAIVAISTHFGLNRADSIVQCRRGSSPPRQKVRLSSERGRARSRHLSLVDRPERTEHPLSWCLRSVARLCSETKLIRLSGTLVVVMSGQERRGAIR